jgi:hypothetical protein
MDVGTHAGIVGGGTAISHTCTRLDSPPWDAYHRRVAGSYVALTSPAALAAIPGTANGMMA